MRTNLHFAAIILILCGCTSTSAPKGGIVGSLENLTTEHQQNGFFEVKQSKVASIPGWLPFPDLGGLYFYKAHRNPSSAIGISPTDTYVLTHAIEASCDLDCLLEINQKIVELDAAALKLLRTKAKLTSLKLKGLELSNRQLPQSETLSLGQEETKSASSVDAASDMFDKKFSEASLAINRSGVFLYRWSTGTEKKGGLSVGSLFGAKGESKKLQNGYALVSGLQMKTLFVGDDFGSQFRESKSLGNLSNNIYFTTHMMQGKHIIYGSLSDYESEYGTKLKASYKELANLPDTIAALDNIEVEAAISKIANLSNVGIMSNIKRSEKRLLPCNTNITNSNTLFQDLNNDWETFYSVQSEYSELKKLVRDNANESKCNNK